MKSSEIIKNLESHANPKNVEGMSRFGIKGGKMLGVSVPVLRKMAKEITKASKNRHELAQELWDSGVHEARMLGSMIEDAGLVTEKQMDEWTKDFDSWDICDQACMNLFARTTFAWKKVPEYAKREEEFVRRTAFSLIACLAWQEKDENRDNELMKFLPLIKKYSTDERNFVRKAVNWALRQIGKRNRKLNKKAIAAASEIAKIDSKSARWIAADALRELEGSAVQGRLKEKS